MIIPDYIFFSHSYQNKPRLRGEFSFWFRLVLSGLWIGK